MIYHSTHSDDYLWYLILIGKQIKTHPNTKFLLFFKLSEQYQKNIHSEPLLMYISIINFCLRIWSGKLSFLFFIGTTGFEGVHFFEQVFQDIRMVDASVTSGENKMSYELFKFSVSLIFGSMAPPRGTICANIEPHDYVPSILQVNYRLKLKTIVFFCAIKVTCLGIFWDGVVFPKFFFVDLLWVNNLNFSSSPDTRKWPYLWKPLAPLTFFLIKKNAVYECVLSKNRVVLRDFVQKSVLSQ